MKELAEFLAVARVVRPRGRQGEVVAEILTDFPERFDPERSNRWQGIYLERPDKRPEPVHLEKAWSHKGRIILKFSGINSIEEASFLRGFHVLIRREERMLLPAHRYYVWELKGCRVVRERGDGSASPVEIGTVTDVETGFGGVDLLHVSLSSAGHREVLVPLAQSICKRIDVEAKVISIDPPEELLELNQ